MIVRITEDEDGREFVVIHMSAAAAKALRNALSCAKECDILDTMEREEQVVYGELLAGLTRAGANT